MKSLKEMWSIGKAIWFEWFEKVWKKQVDIVITTEVLFRCIHAKVWYSILLQSLKVNGFVLNMVKVNTGLLNSLH